MLWPVALVVTNRDGFRERAVPVHGCIARTILILN